MEMKKIKEARIKKGISQTSMANEIGLSQPGYANIENGETKNIPLLVAVKISKVLEIGFNELYDIDGDSQKIDNLNKEIDTLKKRIAELEEQLNDKRRIINLIENDDVLSEIALTIRSIIEPFEYKERDWSDPEALIKELEEKQPYDRESRESTRQYILSNLDVLKKDKINPPRLSNFSD